MTSESSQPSAGDPEPIWKKGWFVGGLAGIAVLLLIGVIATSGFNGSDGQVGAAETTTTTSDNADDPPEPSTTSATLAATTTTTEATTTTTSRPTTTTTRIAPAQDPMVIEEGFWTAGDLERGGWVAVVENPNTDWLLTNVFFDINIVDADNRVIETGFDSALVILPNDVVAITGTVLDPVSEIESIEIEATWDTQEVSGQSTGNFILSEVDVSEERRITEFSGTITSNFQEEFELVSIIIILKNSAGEIVGADTGFVDAVDPERETVWNVTVLDPPTWETFDVYVTP